MPTDPDPTRMREQPALTTSRGAIWLVLGGLFAAISLGVLIPMAWLPNGAIALAAAVTVVVLYLGMVLARVALPEGPRRFGMLATGMLLVAAVALVGVVVVAASAWEDAVG